MVWAILRGRTVVYRALIEDGGLNLTEAYDGVVVESRVVIPSRTVVHGMDFFGASEVGRQ
jgi:hypothetical protein